VALDLRLTGAESALAQVISRLSAEAQRGLAASVAERMLTDAGFDPASVRTELAAGAYGDTTFRQQLREQATAADVRAREAMSARDPAWKELRMPARALTAAVFALAENPEEAALEVAYEARYAYPQIKA
jgi:hypothetical protein